MNLLKADEQFTFDDVLLVPQFSTVRSRREADTTSQLGNLKLKVPIISSNMDTITGIDMAKYMFGLGGLGVIHRGWLDHAFLDEIFDSWDYNKHGPVVLSVGSKDINRELKRLQRILEYDVAGVDLALCVDFAHGDCQASIDTIRYIRDAGFGGDIIGGAVCTPKACITLAEAGATMVRVGVGAGSACKTRVVAGCGYPQLSAIEHCAAYSPIPIIADGGIRNSADFAKAMAAGASAIMVGGILAGSDMTPVWKPDGQEVAYRGMASNAAKNAVNISSGYEEGISVMLPSLEVGSTERIIKELRDGLQSAMSYQNAFNLKDFVKNAVFIKVSNSTIMENVPHKLFS